jgi:hypothetical protein
MPIVKKKKKVSRNNNNNELQALSKTRTWVDFINNDAYLMFPEKLDWRKRFILTMLEWADQEDSLELQDFAVEMKIARSTLYKWGDDFSEVGAALKHVRLMLASRKRKGALRKEFDKDVAFRDMHVLDPEWREINQYHADLKKAEEHQPTTFILHTDKPAITSQEELKEELRKVMNHDKDSE